MSNTFNVIYVCVRSNEERLTGDYKIVGFYSIYSVRSEYTIVFCS